MGSPETPSLEEPRACPNCGAEVGERARRCQVCRTKLPRPVSPEARRGMVLALVAAIGVLGVGVMALVSQLSS